jgi:hypothetical protein
VTIAEMRVRIEELDELIADMQAERADLRASVSRELYRRSAAAKRLEARQSVPLNRWGKPMENPPHPALPPERD